MFIYYILYMLIVIICLSLYDKKNNKIVINIQNKEFMQQRCIVVKIWDKIWEL